MNNTSTHHHQNNNRKVRFEGKIYDAKLITPTKDDSSNNNNDNDRVQIQLPCGIIVPPRMSISKERDVLLLRKMDENNSSTTSNDDENKMKMLAMMRTIGEIKNLHDISAKWLRSVLILSTTENNNVNVSSGSNNNNNNHIFSEINKLHITSEEENNHSVDDDNNSSPRRTSSHVVIECYSVKHENDLGRPVLTLFGKFLFGGGENNNNKIASSSSSWSFFARESKAYEILIKLGLDAKNIIAPICYHGDGGEKLVSSSSSCIGSSSSSASLLLQELPLTYTRFEPRNATTVMDSKTGETLQVVPDVRPELKRIAVSLSALHEAIHQNHHHSQTDNNNHNDDDKDKENNQEELSSSIKRFDKIINNRFVIEQSLCSDRVFFAHWRLSLQPHGEEYLNKIIMTNSNKHDDFKYQIANQILNSSSSSPAEDVLLSPTSSSSSSSTSFIHGSLHDTHHTLLDRENHRSPAVFVDWKRCGLSYREIDLLHLCACCLHPVIRKEHNMVEYFLKEYVQNCRRWRRVTTTKKQEEKGKDEVNDEEAEEELNQLRERMKFICRILTMTKSGELCDWVPNEKIRFELMRLLNDEWNALSD